MTIAMFACVMKKMVTERIKNAPYYLSLHVKLVTASTPTIPCFVEKMMAIMLTMARNLRQMMIRGAMAGAKENTTISTGL